MQHAQAIEAILGKLKEELPHHLHYHSFEHTALVMESAREIALAENITGTDLFLLLTAAAYHDSGFLINHKNHEAAGCGLAEKMLPDFGYTTEQITVIQGMIMATKIPQDLKTKLEKVLCDADLAYLGGSKYHEISRNLFLELNALFEPMSEEQWNALQVNFLEHHHFWTTFCNERYSKPKQNTLAELKAAR